MLFLAVFCGFLAENQREHFVEHQREKQYARSMLEDLATDTTELAKAIRQTDSASRYADSVIIFLESFIPRDQVPIQLVELIGRAGRRLTLINTDRTSSQLKNSGAMRLMRNKKVVDGILRYWKQIDETNISLERYLIYRNVARELSFKLYTLPEVYERRSNYQPGAISNLKIFDPDPKKWNELANLTAMCGRINQEGHLPNLREQYNQAVGLILEIKKAYSIH